MTYSEFRNQFSDTWRFRNAYGSLTYEEAKAMIDAETCPPGDKAAMIDAWREAILMNTTANSAGMTLNTYTGLTLKTRTSF